MFSREAYVNYLREIQKIESQMLANIKELKDIIFEPRAAELLESIYRDELEHYGLEDELIKLLGTDA